MLFKNKRNWKTDFLKLKTCNFIKNESLAQVFSYRTPTVAAFGDDLQDNCLQNRERNFLDILLFA